MDSLQQFLIAGILLIALAATLHVLQRRGLVHFTRAHGRPERKLQMLERLQITPQHALCLVRFGNRSLLIGAAPSGCRLLQDQPLPEGEPL